MMRLFFCVASVLEGILFVLSAAGLWWDKRLSKVVFLCSVGLGGYFICAECSGVMVGQKIV
ncbi:MAG: hypothetical protein FWD76_01400, partial [Firmicutes bacterium]|nr:hypothetical protein [Bacillota bacterium]